MTMTTKLSELLLLLLLQTATADIATSTPATKSAHSRMITLDLQCSGSETK